MLIAYVLSNCRPFSTLQAQGWYLLFRTTFGIQSIIATGLRDGINGYNMSYVDTLAPSQSAHIATRYAQGQ